MSVRRGESGDESAPVTGACPVAKRPTSRRRFLLDGATSACCVGILGLALAAYSRRSVALPPQALRPPGARGETDFLGACLRCGACVRACPPAILRLAKPEDSVAVGTPYFTARSSPCAMCAEMPCVRACPTDALDHALGDIVDARMGLAVLSDREACVNQFGLLCDMCYRSCPVADEAITLEPQQYKRASGHAVFLPTVHAEFCTGCGNCESACILGEPAIKVFPVKLARADFGRDFQPVWQTPDDTGRSADGLRKRARPAGIMIMAPDAQPAGGGK